MWVCVMQVSMAAAVAQPITQAPLLVFKCPSHATVSMREAAIRVFDHATANHRGYLANVLGRWARGI